jgi:hypothetical protein
VRRDYRRTRQHGHLRHRPEPAPNTKNDKRCGARVWYLPRSSGYGRPQ